jgi:RHS repeat-associated protein
MKEQINRNNSYTPFGDTLSTSAGETARLGFIGQEQDIEPRHSSGSPLRSDMVWLNDTARYYDPEIGRFLSVDPLFEMYTEYTPYNYCNNSPMMFRDPSGLGLEIALVEGQLTLIYVTDQVDVTAERTPDESDWYNIPRLGGGGGSLAKGVNKMGYSSLISGIMNNNAPLHSFFYFNFAESGEMNWNARGIGNTGSANGKSNSSNGGGSGSAGIPKEARLDYEAEEKQVNTLDYLDNLNYVATEFVQQAPVLSYCYDASKNINNGEYLQAGINFLSGVGDAILFFGTLGTATLATTTGKQLMKQGGKMALSKTVTYSKHALKQMDERKLNEKWIKSIIKNGEQLFDLRNGNTIYLLREGSAKGHHVAVVVNSTTNNHIISVLKGRNIINKKWLPIK